MPKVDLESIEQTNRTGYPPPFDRRSPAAGTRLAPATGLTDFGASHVVLKPGAWSSQRHWHDGEDEFLVMLAGEAVLVEDEGETVLRAGDCRRLAQGHCQRPPSDQPRATSRLPFVAVGGGTKTGGGYSDIDMLFDARTTDTSTRTASPY